MGQRQEQEAYRAAAGQRRPTGSFMAQHASNGLRGWHTLDGTEPIGGYVSSNTMGLSSESVRHPALYGSPSEFDQHPALQGLPLLFNSRS